MSLPVGSKRFSLTYDENGVISPSVHLKKMIPYESIDELARIADIIGNTQYDHVIFVGNVDPEHYIIDNEGSEVFGYLALLVAVGFAGLGAYQLGMRKSLFKVDYDLYVLAAFYVVVLILYVAFDKIAINYRPVMIEGLEASDAFSAASNVSLSISAASSLGAPGTVSRNAA